MDFYNIDQSIPWHLPLLDELVEKHIGTDVFKEVTILLIQHQLGNHFPQVKALKDLGQDPTKLIWIDIPYTATVEVRKSMIKDLKIPEENFRIHAFHVLDRYPPYQIRRVQEIFKELLVTVPNRLVVLDDGAYFLEAASCFAKQLPTIAIVEQTTRGLIKIEESAVLRQYSSSIPIINVARSLPKLTLEPPFIGKAICDSLSNHLKTHLCTPDRLRCLVLGYGAIGKQVAKFLSMNSDFDQSLVHVHDPDITRQRAALNAGFLPWDRTNYTQRFNLVLGCSGHQSFKLDDRVYLEDGAILASASSGTVELSRQDFIELAAVSEIDDIDINKGGLNELDVHSDINIKLVDRTVTFLNGGFPINFDGRVNCIPGHYIQPTPTMMVAATMQAVKAIDNHQRGLIELDPAFCEWLDLEFRRELGKESSLLPPIQGL